MNRVALVTGGAAGLGAGVAERLAELGMRVAITYRPGGTAPDASLARLRRYDRGADAFPVDLARSDDAAQCVREVERRFGAIDSLVHAAGPIAITRFERSTLAAYRTMIEANLTSAVALALAVLPSMRERRFGRLIFFGMTGSSVTRPARGLSFYGAAKAGLVAFARTLALEEAQYGVTVNVVEPGDIREKNVSRAEARLLPARNPSGRSGSWEDIAEAVGFFLGERSDFVNGAVLAVGGGLVDASE